MKVVQVNAVYEYSSTGRTTMELDLALKRDGHDSYVFCTNRSDEPHGIYCMGTPFTRKIHGLMSRLTGLQGYYSKSATREMLKRFDEIKPDVVHLGNLHGNYIHVNMLLEYLAKHNIPTVITLHDCWLFTGHCCHYLQDNCYRWQDNCGKCPAKHKWNNSWFFDRSAKVLKDRRERFGRINPLVIVGVSDWVTNECRKSFMKQNARFKRIYNWIDLERFSPDPNGTPKKGNRILSVAQTWSQLKGLDDIIKIANKCPEFTFVMIGALPGGVTLPQNIEALGVIQDVDELVDEYRKADVLLHLSYQETFGKVIIEAQACGTPAVVYDVTAMPELIGPECGKVVKKGDWEAAGDALIDLIKTNSVMIDNYMAEFVKKNFSKKKLVEDKIDVLLETVGGGKY